MPDSMPYGYLRNSDINDFDYLGLASGKCTYYDKDGIRHNENGINCLGYAIGLGYAVAPWSNSLDFFAWFARFFRIGDPF